MHTATTRRRHHGNMDTHSYGPTFSSHVIQASGPYSGPFVEVTGIFEKHKTIPVRLHVPMSAISIFMTAESALGQIAAHTSAKIDASKITKESTPKFIENHRNAALHFVTLMRNELDTMQKAHPDGSEGVVWSAQISPEFKFLNDVILIHPNENEKVASWMDGGPLSELVDIIRYAPALSGAMGHADASDNTEGIHTHDVIDVIHYGFKEEGTPSVGKVTILRRDGSSVHHNHVTRRFYNILCRQHGIKPESK